MHVSLADSYSYTPGQVQNTLATLPSALARAPGSFFAFGAGALQAGQDFPAQHGCQICIGGGSAMNRIGATQSIWDDISQGLNNLTVNVRYSRQ